MAAGAREDGVCGGGKFDDGGVESHSWIIGQPIAICYNYCMALIHEIRSKFAKEMFEFSRHAADQTILREITVDEMRQTVKSGKIIETYPDDKYGPSCLLFGFSKSGRPLHLQCSYPVRPLIKIITVYEPDPAEWADYQIRR